MRLPPDVEVIDGGTEGYELIRFLRDRTKVVIVDALSAHEPPGTLTRATPDQLDLHWTPSYSSHQSGLRELLYAAQALPTPPEIVILGVVPEETCGVGTDLSESVAGVMDMIIGAVLATASLSLVQQNT
jgi:hydrogenase maturation protease